MIANYLKVAVQNLVGGKLYSAINILGLATGLACCLLISLFVRHELSYDQFFANAERIYRVAPDFAESGMGPERHPAGNVAPLGPIIAAAGISGVEQVARIGDMHALIGKDEVAGYEENFRWADPALFSIFQLEWLRGTGESALARPDNVAISAAMARKYFGDRDPLGETLLLENTWPLTVSGVFADLPQNSHLSADFIITMDMAWKLLDFNYENNWAFTRFHTYLLLRPEARIDEVLERISERVSEVLADGLGERFGIAAGSLSFTAHQMADIHLHSTREGEFKTPGSLSFVFTFSAIATVLLLIACINFTNLATARATRRAKEVGVRKAIGAGRRELVGQFLCESLLCSLSALVIALALVELLLPIFSTVVDRQLNSAMLASSGFIAFIVGVVLATTLVAGSYPAFYLAAFNPVGALHNRNGSIGRGLTLRNILVVAQFSASIVLLVATVVVALQMQFVRRYDLGFNRDNVLVLWGTHFDGLGQRWEPFKEALLQNPNVVRITEGDMTPGSAGSRRMRLGGGAPEGVNLLAKQVGFGFFETYDIALLAGRYFDPAIATDLFVPPPSVPPGGQRRGSYILNQSAVRALGLTPETALGGMLEMDFSSDFSLTVPGPIIGVVEDVHLHSLREPIQPMAYFVPTLLWGEQFSFDIASVRLRNDDARTLAWVADLWRQYMPDMPFIYHFLETDFAALYQAEERQGQLFTFFATLAILIASLGLFGLAAFMVERRRKEIGVRKVMGSGVWRIVLLLTSDFSRLVLLANLIAWPIAYLAMQRWLEHFAYRIDLTPLIFIGSGAIALCIAWVTVAGTAAKAASQKPVLALRYE